ncbi:3-hydroxyacyl-CoA dehydrogenase NAD-binding domain-containing protein [Rubrimonas cliftonensis]|uniref:3-hydroxyacyl-CoA dehydrogenase n=1 Tax=Rubrimonas cliftonensis TaxID=89524 RepID=A0A1H4ARC1_9RHOB|nr:3-hydroxyacyl-CoA dehydrogenase NAD-binding domain-containing protein [Rubrimonas cliftonensis]SEA38440.1 3-hydroxyacyl-CoA dehydrogenase [Rubrimonas cliftonensis]
MTEIFSYSVDDGVAVIAWDLPGASMNVLTLDGVAQLDACVDRALADPEVRGAVIASGKRDFAGGMDLGVIATMKERAGADPAAAIFGFVMQLHGVLRKIERAGADPKTGKGGKPFAWASPGTAMGIGLELGLACHRRFAADNPKAKIGLPEILVGIFPGAGGTTRLVRMMGVMAAAPFLLEGKTPDPARAKSAGLIDEVTPPDALLETAKAWARGAGEAAAVKPWDQKGYKLPGGAPYTPAGFPVFLGAVAMTHGKSRGAYPAPKAMLSAVYEGALVDFDTAIRIEARWFTSVLMNPSSEAMIRSLFIDKQALEKGASRPFDVPDQTVRKLGVLGAGMMGAGVAYVSLLAGMEVVLIDRDAAAAERGRATVESLCDGAVKARRLDADGRAATLARLTATPDYAALQGCDLVVEAVFEDPRIKAEATAKAEAHLGGNAVFATNTSTLPIGELARASRDPARFIGIHFFSPVHKMMLVEIIKGAQTGDVAVAKALDFVRQLRKTPIVVNDARFFYANRCIIPYINEGLRMIAEGMAPSLIDNAAKMLGMPVGPLQLTDETSLELGLSIARATKAATGDADPENPADALLEALVETHGRKGRKNGKGLYDYDDRGKRLGFWPGLAGMHPHAPEQPPLEDVQNRLMLAQALEAVRAYEEGVLTDMREGDVGAILGWGFAPWSGGPFSWIDMTGPARVVAICDDLAARCGARFAAPALLRETAAAGGRLRATATARAA